jgi:hypothetical protein
MYELPASLETYVGRLYPVQAFDSTMAAHNGGINLVVKRPKPFLCLPFRGF